jgi:initiation factor 1A
MVKNTTGGSKHKGFARKEFSSNYNNKLRLSDNEFEIYAHVTKMFGNGMCETLCQDMVKRTCIIRGKFRGKGKRTNFIVIGSIVLVGIRHWETDSNKCDLLEFYDPNEIDQLKNNPKVPSDFLSFNPLSPISNPSDPSILFSNIILSDPPSTTTSSHNTTLFININDI